MHSKDVDLHAKALIAIVAWLIGENRRNLVFQGCPINYNKIVAGAWSLCLSFNNAHFREIRCQSLSNHSIKIFIDASWVSKSSPSGLGLIIISNLNLILLVGAEGKGVTSDSPIMAELAAINFALHFCHSNG